jgi:hypothetical protein
MSVVEAAKKVKQIADQDIKVRHADPALVAQRSTAEGQLEGLQAQLAAVVAKIWNAADPGVMNLVKTQEVMESWKSDCADLKEGYDGVAAQWVGKTRPEFEAHFMDVGLLRHTIIVKYLGGSGASTKVKLVGNKDPIAAQKFADVDAEQHVDPAHGNLKKSSTCGWQGYSTRGTTPIGLARFK